jgi:HD superfamily phosphohydrolase
MIIKDCIYRFVKVSPLCEAFVNTPEFQRLRQIKQLGLAYYVYPSAVHTRFEHCLGVMHLAGRVIDVLRRDEVITDREKDLVQLAGLLHDVGHVAFSHMMDDLLTEQEHKLASHEDRSVMLVTKINDRLRLLSPSEEFAVARMIHGEILDDEQKPFLYEIVCNQAYGLDVDKLDYLQRDSYHTGMPSFQPDYLIECLHVKNGRLVVKKKGRSEIELMYDARKRLLLLVCRHRAVMIVEKFIREAIQKLELTECFDTKEWLGLTDASAQYLMDAHCSEIMERIYTRDWDGVNGGNKLDHISNVSREDIDAVIKTISWC